MFTAIKNRMMRDTDYPERSFTIDILTRVLKGTFYNHLPYDFNTEKNLADEYIPLRDRRPSVTYRLAKLVVDDSVSMLFSEGHFPDVDCQDITIREALLALIKEARLNETMIEAATVGSVGSVAIILRVLKNRVFFKVMSTQYLTPTFDPTEPDKLLKVREQYKVKGDVLADMGYNLDDEKIDYWFARDFDSDTETFYLPWPVRSDDVDDKPAKLKVDKKRSVTHSLGFVPIVWIKNLPGGDDIDGECTFEAAINTSIEIDYQLSQAGRGLKYSSDPTLLIKEPAVGTQGEMVKGGGDAIVVSAEGDAKLLEINGSAASTVIEYVRHLRELALETVHGNRANADKLSAAQSGRSQELMNQALVWLADRLRITYGEYGLLALLKMVVQASDKYPLMINGKKIKALNQQENIVLRWPAWYAPTADDRMKMASTLKILSDSGHLSQDTAVKTIAADYDIEDINQELKQIKDDQAQRLETLKPATTEMIQA